MEVNIWSDIRCPFCYIGKHKFEAALKEFPQKDQITLIWHSFELDPNMETQPDIDAIDHLAQSKGMTREQAEQMMGNVVQAAEGTGITFNFDQSVEANSFNAHRLIQLAKSKRKANALEEILFKAHFTDGKNIDDKEDLLKIGTEAGLEKEEVKEVLSSDAYTKEVRADEEKAQSLGIRGVPFFVFNNKYAVSGAQPPEAFSQALEQSWQEYVKENKSPFIVNEGATCDTDGNCD